MRLALPAVLLLLLTTPLAAQDPLAEIAQDVRRGLGARKQVFLADSLPGPRLEREIEWLQQQYARAGLPVRIADEAEFDAYFMSMMFATIPDAEFARMPDNDGRGRTAFLAAWLAAKLPLSPLPFTPEAWRAAERGTERVRYRRFKDLRERVKLEGMTVAEPEGLRGRPARTEEAGSSTCAARGWGSWTRTRCGSTSWTERSRPTASSPAPSSAPARCTAARERPPAGCVPAGASRRPVPRAGYGSGSATPAGAGSAATGFSSAACSSTWTRYAPGNNATW